MKLPKDCEIVEDYRKKNGLKVERLLAANPGEAYSVDELLDIFDFEDEHDFSDPFFGYVWGPNVEDGFFRFRNVLEEDGSRYFWAVRDDSWDDLLDDSWDWSDYFLVGYGFFVVVTVVGVVAAHFAGVI